MTSKEELKIVTKAINDPFVIAKLKETTNVQAWKDLLQKELAKRLTPSQEQEPEDWQDNHF